MLLPELVDKLEYGLMISNLVSMSQCIMLIATWVIIVGIGYAFLPRIIKSYKERASLRSNPKSIKLPEDPK